VDEADLLDMSPALKTRTVDASDALARFELQAEDSASGLLAEASELSAQAEQLEKRPRSAGVPRDTSTDTREQEEEAEAAYAEEEVSSRWVTLRARWVTLRARWVTLRARWVTLRARWVTRRARWVTVRALAW
jgi:hypothetical protein